MLISSGASQTIPCIRKRFWILSQSTFSTVIPKNAAISYAAFERKPLILVDALAPGAVAYLALADEIIKRSEPLKWRIEFDDESEDSPSFPIISNVN